MRFTQAELQQFRDRTVPDLLPDPLRLLFIGINPGLWSAATGAHFARRGNRFYPALHRAGLTRHLIDASDGYKAEDLAELHARGIGISNLVPRASARADELTAEELAAAPARLTVTFGFGPELVRRVAPDRAPARLRPLPAFEQIDRLDPAFSDGDLLLQICGDDRMSVAHARRMLLKAARPFATERWVQEGFRSARGAHPTGTTMRNLFGQVDGTGNPAADTPHLDRVVWGVGAEQVGVTPWIADGTSVVIRRIEMLMDTWDELDRPAKEKVIGRRLGTGAPLTGEQEHDEPDFDAVGPTGFLVISDIAHLRRARGEEPEYGMLRRSYNYDDPRGALEAGSGLIFAAYQADVDRQFVPVQARLAEADHLNLWTVPVGSAVFAIPPGCAEGGFVGDALFA